MKILTVLGTRPDWCANAMLIKMLDKWLGKDFILCHSGQHYDYLLNEIFFEQLDIREPDHFFEIGSGSDAYQIGELLKKSEDILKEEKPDLVLSFSDANPSQFAISATKLGIRVAHLEAGMRSGDFRMPEEKNRLIIDAISNYFFTPVRASWQNLMNEGKDASKCCIVNKQIIDTVEEHKKEIEASKVLEEHNLYPKEYFLTEIHRKENTESKENLTNIMRGLQAIWKEFGLTIIAAFHPRTMNALQRYGFTNPEGISFIGLQGMFEFEALVKNALCCISDSGTIQETACYYGTPVVTTRPSTERVEAIECGASMLVGEKDGSFIPTSILRATQEMLNRKWDCPYTIGANAKILTGLEKIEHEEPSIWW